jgi:hypothetical protein
VDALPTPPTGGNRMIPGIILGCVVLAVMFIGASLVQP